MTIVIASFILIFISFLIRRRFIKESKVNFFFQGFGVSLFLWVISAFLVCVIYFYHIVNCLSADLYLEYLLLSGVCLSIIVSLQISFFMTKGPINNTYFSNRRTKNIYIGINKQFIPTGTIKSESERVEFINRFIKRVVTLKGIRCRNIILTSHLFAPGISKLISASLKNEGALFSCNSYTLKRAEIITLNLLYGGKTRYRIFSLKKHPNGFKVHKIGRTFTIKKITGSECSLFRQFSRKNFVIPPLAACQVNLQGITGPSGPVMELANRNRIEVHLLLAATGNLVNADETGTCHHED